MKKEWADKWVAALRSGQYKQGKHKLLSLTREDGEAVPSFCCLGVLCDLVKDEPEIKASWGSDAFIINNRREFLSLPFAVERHTGMNSDLGLIDEDTTLAILNDKEGKTFTELADIIEGHWETL